MTGTGDDGARSACRLSLDTSGRGQAHRRWALRIATLSIPAVVGILFALHLREGFGPARLAAKTLLPFAILAPLAIFLPAGRTRRLAATGLVVLLGWAAMATCVAVFGVPLDPQLLAGFFRVIRPELLAIALGAAMAVGMVRSWILSGAPAPLEAATNALFAVTEGVYFGGFLIGGTGHMDAWIALPAIAAGQALVAGARGVPARRALLGAAALTAAALWAGNAYAAIAVHLVLLGSPPLGLRLRAPASRPAFAYPDAGGD